MLSCLIICSFIRSIAYAFAYRYLFANKTVKQHQRSSRLSRLRFVCLLFTDQRKCMRSQKHICEPVDKVFLARTHTHFILLELHLQNLGYRINRSVLGINRIKKNIVFRFWLNFNRPTAKFSLNNWFCL